MKKNEAGGKIVQRVERGATVEINKATGSEKNISARDADFSHDVALEIGSLSDRVMDYKRKASKKAVQRTKKKARDLPESHRLKFTAEERADPITKKSALKSEKAAQRYEKAKGKIPQHRRPTQNRTNPANTKKNQKTAVKKKMQSKFIEHEKLPSGKLKHVLEIPGREIGLLVHREIRKSDNVGVESAHFAERSTKFIVGKMSDGYRALKFRPERAALRANKKATKANVKALYDKSLRNRPELRKANLLKKAMHKRKIKKMYAKKVRQEAAKNTARTARTVRLVAKVIYHIIRFLAKSIAALKVKILGAIIIVLLVVALIALLFSLFSSFGGGGFNTIILTSYTAEDEDILGADADYEAMGAVLAARIANIENEYPGYDEYHYYLDDIGHDPYTLASYLTARYFAYTRAEVQADLAMLFQQQYELTFNHIIEIRTRTEIHTEIIITIDDETGEEIEEEIEVEVEVEYEYHILEITLKNKGLQMIVIPHLSIDELEMFRVYQETQGNRPELFENHPYANRGAYLKYEVPPEALSDERFAAILKEAEKYLGYPYVWGGSSPSTSFDCSGFVSWVINNTFWNVGRLGARGLFDICTPVAPSEAKPGDLIFFNYTYNAPQPHLPTHVGIYVGGGMMIHCGNPISYASITTNYWTKHFYAFGRLP